MTTPQAVFCADLQARESAYRGVRELCGDDLHALQQVSDLANKLGVPLIMGGDQVDSPVISDEHVIKIRRILSGPGSPPASYYIDGNHERGFKRLCLEGGRAAAAVNLETHYRQTGSPVQLGSLTVAGLNFRTRPAWRELLDKGYLPDADVLVVHGFCDQVIPDMKLGFTGPEGQIRDMDLSWFDGRYKTVLMGDIHMQWCWTGPAGTTFHYPGSMWMHRPNEPVDKFALILMSDGRVERHQLTCRPFISRSVGSVYDMDYLEGWLSTAGAVTHLEHLRAPDGRLARIHLAVDEEVASDVSTRIRALEEKAFVFSRVVYSGESSMVDSLVSTPEGLDLDAALCTLVKEGDKIDAEAASFVSNAMLRGLDVSVDDLRRRHGVV